MYIPQFWIGLIVGFVLGVVVVVAFALCSAKKNKEKDE